jgi:hypothetical protein
MSDQFESNVKFSDRQIEIMGNEIGEILGRLKERNVFDFKEKVPVILLDRGSTDINFAKTDILKVKRFISLVQDHLGALTYLARNPSFMNITKDVERDDRIMGAVNYKKTTLLRHRGLTYANKVICSEIHRSYDTPENRLLALILFAIMTYCDKYISIEGLVESIEEQINPTIEELQYIRRYVAILLSVKSIKQILPMAIDSRNDLDSLFDSMLKRIRLGKTHRYFAKIFNLFYKWKYYISVSLDDTEISKHVLQYHFMNLADKNDLYECWIFCKVLYAISEIFDLKFTEASGSRGAAIFRSNDGFVKIIYQATYDTDWKDQGKFFEDIPDIAIEFKNAATIIIDAKNSHFRFNNISREHQRQMDSYLRSAPNGQYGIFVHSDSEDPSLWKTIINEKHNQEINWTCLVPGSSETTNTTNIERIIKMIQKGK